MALSFHPLLVAAIGRSVEESFKHQPKPPKPSFPKADGFAGRSALLHLLLRAEEPQVQLRSHSYDEPASKRFHVTVQASLLCAMLALPSICVSSSASDLTLKL